MKKIFLWTGISVFLIVSALLLARLFSDNTVSVYHNGNEISVSSSSATESDDLLISAEDVFNATNIEFDYKDGKAYANGKKLLEIDTVANTVKIDGNVHPASFSVSGKDIMIPPYLAAEALGVQSVTGENEIRFVDTTPIQVYFRESGKAMELSYDDQFFFYPSTNYNHSLARLSIGMAVSAFSSKDADKFWGENGNFGRESDIIRFFNSLGFNNIKTYNYDKSLNSTDDSVAFAIAEKEIDNNGKAQRLVALSIRGGVYGNEWVSNFNLGNTQIHKGFLLASDEVVKSLYSYLGSNTENAKLWITGYSRGGAVAGITAARITDEGKIKPENIYSYTFAAPNQTKAENAKSDKYGHIFNILSDIDLVPLIPPQKWGFMRYGKDVYLPSMLDFEASAAAEQSQNICEIYKSISDAGEFNLLETEKSNQKQHIRSVVDSICSTVKSSISYTDKYDDILMDFVRCNNTKIKKNGSWKWASSYEGFASIYEDAEVFLEKARENQFLKNAESILGEAGEKIIVLGAVCILHGENPYDVIVKEIGIENLSVLASVLSGFDNGSAAIAKAHYPETYISQMLSNVNPALMRGIK